jgi:hypothetical protein
MHGFYPVFVVSVRIRHRHSVFFVLAVMVVETATVVMVVLVLVLVLSLLVDAFKSQLHKYCAGACKCVCVRERRACGVRACMSECVWCVRACVSVCM